MAKMDDAQASMTAAKPRSRRAPVGRELRKARTAEGVMAEGASGGMDGSAMAAMVFGGGIANLDVDSLDVDSVEIGRGDTSALFQMQTAACCIVRGGDEVDVAGHRLRRAVPLTVYRI